MAPRQARPIPTGQCWCGCGNETSNVGAFFLHGHDRVAEAAVILNEYGGIPQMMLKHGYGPGGKNARETWERIRGN